MHALEQLRRLSCMWVHACMMADYRCFVLIIVFGKSGMLIVLRLVCQRKDTSVVDCWIS